MMNNVENNLGLILERLYLDTVFSSNTNELFNHADFTKIASCGTKISSGLIFYLDHFPTQVICLLEAINPDKYPYKTVDDAIQYWKSK